MVKFHKQNSRFQIKHFLAGSCHTVDAAYFMLRELQEERQASINNYKVVSLKQDAKEIKAKKVFVKVFGKYLFGKGARLEAKAELIEIFNNRMSGKVLYEAAIDELNFITNSINKLQSLRKYKNKSDLEAHELIQREEWKLELIHRAENYMITSGSIPSEHLVTMRMHPEFKKEIFPEIENLMLQLSSPEKSMKYLKNLDNKFLLE